MTHDTSPSHHLVVPPEVLDRDAVLPIFINLLIYSDSLAFRRKGQPQDMSFTYPFLLRGMIEEDLGLKANLLMRGGGGIRIRELAETVCRDTAYFGGDPNVLNVAVMQCGIVDCAPRPITYALSPFLRRLPYIGPKVLAQLVKRRRGLQSLCSYTVTSRRAFRRIYKSMVYACRSAHIRVISVGLPLPTLEIEYRSPGFRRSAAIYNDLIRDVIPESFCDIERQMTESLRESLLLSDGHHLTEAGHHLYAASIFDQLRRLL